MKLFNAKYVICIIWILLVFVVTDSLALENSKEAVKAIKIGLLIPDNKSIEAKYGVEMAIRKVNEKGGINQQKFQVITRLMEGPWGTGSKEAVDLIFNENVWVIIGSHDGRNAHLVEQVAAKEHLVFLSAWASDPTLSQAFVPWYFSCVPNDNQQAAALIEEIYHKKNTAKVAIVSDNSYDSNLAVKSFLQKTKAEGVNVPMQYSSGNSEKEIDDLLNRIHKEGAKCIVLLGQPDFSWKFIRLMRSKKMDQEVYGSLFSLGDRVSSDPEFAKNGKIVFVSSAFYLSDKGKEFQKEFEKIYGNKPTEAAAYAFDAANLIVEAIRNADYDRDKIKSELAKMHYEGVTGSIQFDDKGNRTGIPELIEITNGIPVAVGRHR